MQEASRRRPEIVQSRTDATLGDVAAERETKRWRTWLPVPVANLICLAVHWYVSKTEPPAETRSYFVFLWNFLAVSFLLAVAQLWLPALRRRMRQMGPIFAAALLTLCAWEVLTSGFRWLPLPYFPGPAAVFQSLINDRALLLDSTWHSLVLLLGGYALGVIAGLISGICIGWSTPVRYWGMPILKVVGPIPATAWITRLTDMIPNTLKTNLDTLLSDAADNRFFARSGHWPYFAQPGDWVNRFWDRDNDPITLKGIALAFLRAFISARIGLLLGNYLLRLKR